MLVVLSYLVLSCYAASCGDFSTVPAGSNCTITWANLKPIMRPTQTGVGYAWVQSKVDKSFTSSSKSQSELDDNPVPVIMGPPGRTPYCLDSTHTLSALDFSGYSSTVVTVVVVCDWTKLSIDNFWVDMAKYNYSYLLARPTNTPNTLPALVDWTTLPTVIDFTKGKTPSLPDDRWRSLAGFARKVLAGPGTYFPSVTCNSGNKYCMRAYNRGCDANGNSIPFFEFRWAYFMNLAFLDDSFWDNLQNATAFNTVYNAIPYPQSVGSIDTAPWEKAAASLVYLCRDYAAGQYVLPASLGQPLANEKLPGYVAGLDPIPTPDPDCNEPVCPAPFGAFIDTV